MASKSRPGPRAIWCVSPHFSSLVSPGVYLLTVFIWQPVLLVLLCGVPLGPATGVPELSPWAGLGHPAHPAVAPLLQRGTVPRGWGET